MKKILYILSAVTVLSLASCKDYLDINHSPNSPDESQATADMAFPAAEMALSSKYGDVLRIIGGYLSEHYAHFFGTSNYVGYSQFKVAPNSTNSAYVDINRNNFLPVYQRMPCLLERDNTVAVQFGAYSLSLYAVFTLGESVIEPGNRIDILDKDLLILDKARGKLA